MCSNLPLACAVEKLLGGKVRKFLYLLEIRDVTRTGMFRLGPISVVGPSG